MEEVKETNCNCNDNLCEENCTCDENCTCEDACNNECCDDKKNKHDNKKLKKLEHQIEELEKKFEQYWTPDGLRDDAPPEAVEAFEEFKRFFWEDLHQ